MSTNLDVAMEAKLVIAAQRKDNEAKDEAKNYGRMSVKN